MLVKGNNLLSREPLSKRVDCAVSKAAEGSKTGVYMLYMRILGSFANAAYGARRRFERGSRTLDFLSLMNMGCQES